MDKDELLAREFEKLSLKSVAPNFFGQEEPQAILSVKMLLNKLTKWNFYSLLQKYDYESLQQFLLKSGDNCTAFLAVLFRSIRRSPVAVELTTYFLIEILSSPLAKDFVSELMYLVASKISQLILNPITEQDEQERIKALQYKLSTVRMAVLLESHSLLTPLCLDSIFKSLLQSKPTDEIFDVIVWLSLNLLEHSLFSESMAQVYKYFTEAISEFQLSERQKILVKLPEEVGGLISERNKQAKGVLVSLFSMFYEIPRPLIQEGLVWIKQDTI